MNLSLALSRPQMAFIKSRTPVAAMICGLGSGKTYVGTLWALLQAIERPGSLGVVGANVPAQIHGVVIPMTRRHVESFGLPFVYGERPPWKSRFESHVSVLSLPNSSQILFKSVFESGLDRSIRGLELDYAYVDEARDCQEAVVDVILGRLRGQKGPRRLRMTSTPNGRRGWLYKRFGPGKPADWDLFTGSTQDNAANLPPGYLENLKRTYSTDQYAQEVLGHWVDLDVGLAYRFDRDKHLARRDFDPSRPLLFSLDLNVNPMVGVVCQHDEEARTMHVLEEIVLRGHAQTRDAIRVLADRYSHKSLQLMHMCDEAGGSRSTRTTATDVTIMKAECARLFRRSRSLNGPAKPLVVDRVNCVNAMLDPAEGPPRLTIDPSCKELILDLESMRWDDQYGKIDKSDPARSHGSDAAGYLCHRLFPIQLSDKPFGLDGALERQASASRPKGFPGPVGA